MTPEDLIGPMRALAMSQTKIFLLTFHDSSLMYIPHGIFKNVSIEKVG